MDQQQLTTADRALLSADAKVSALRPVVALGHPQQAFTDWHRQLAAGIASAHPLDGAKCLARGNHLAAQNDEPEPIDRGPLTQPAELPEDALIEFDLTRNVNKGERLARANDAHALDLQVQLQGFIGGLPA